MGRLQKFSYRHFERSEKSLSFAVCRTVFGISKRETCNPLTFGHRPYIFAAEPLPQRKNGAPYHIKDIVTDMEEAEKMIETLYETLKKAIA